MKLFLVILALVSLVVVAQSQTILQVAQNTAYLSSLVSAITNNSPALVPILNGTAANYTVIAPDNYAFSTVTFNTSVYPTANATLYYHVSTSRSPNFVGSSLPADSTYGSLYGPAFRINNYTALGSPYNAIITINGNPINATPIAASNGEVYVVNQVLYPALGGLTASLTQLSANFSSLAGIYTNNITAQAQGILANTNPITIFAPINQAFALYSANLSGLNQFQTSELLLNHAVNLPVSVFSAALPTTGSVTVPTYDNGNLTITANATGVFVTSQGGQTAQVVLPNLVFNNGVIHGINNVLFPNSLPATTTTTTGTVSTTTGSVTTGAATTGAATTGSATTTSSASTVVLSFFALIAALVLAF
jgi:uncharacterized surface protein with fasciclin (FAS1) repeats